MVCFLSKRIFFCGQKAPEFGIFNAILMSVPVAAWASNIVQSICRLPLRKKKNGVKVYLLQPLYLSL